MASSDKKSVETYYDKVKALMHIRHENIVSFMGASASNQNDGDLKSYAIITNPVRAESLYSRSENLSSMYVATKMSIACQVCIVCIFYMPFNPGFVNFSINKTLLT